MSDIQSYRQRTLLAYIGGRIFLDHPLLGVGWQGSADEYAYRPYLADAQAPLRAAGPGRSRRRRIRGASRTRTSRASPTSGSSGSSSLLRRVARAGRATRCGAAPATRASAAPRLILVALGAWNGYGLDRRGSRSTL